MSHPGMSVKQKEPRRNDDEVSGFENSIENSIVQLVFGNDSLTFNNYDDLIEETSEDENENSSANDDQCGSDFMKIYDERNSGEKYFFDEDLVMESGDNVEFDDQVDLVEFAPELSDNDDNEHRNQNLNKTENLGDYDPGLSYYYNSLFDDNDSADESGVSDGEVADNDEEPVVYQGRPKKGRKRKIPGQSRSDRKRLYNTNKTHVNTKGNIVEEKIFDESFACLCKKKCTDAVSVERRRRLFNQFWSMGTFAGRCAILINCVSEAPKKRSYSKNLIKHRVVTRRYTMFGQITCKMALLKTLQISQKRIALALNKQKFFDSFADCRGKNSGGANAFPVSKRIEVRAHISSFPRYKSHYTRNQTEAKFLNSNLNLAKMYELYKVDAQYPVSKSFYKRVFYEDFNLRYKAPKKDSCFKCDVYAVKIQNPFLSEADRLILEEWHIEHVQQAEVLRSQMYKDLRMAKIDKLLEALTFDFQKILSCPRLATSIVYYLRQLNLYNFGIHEGSSGKGFFNIWLETEASKGTQEVGSCLSKHIATINGPKKLILWSDACGGQNRSIKLILMLIHILQNHETLETISIRYLQSGHSFLPNDSEFGDFECALKRAGNLFTDADAMKIMSECRTKNKFTINRLSSRDFFSVRNLEKEITNRKVDVDKNKINWLDTHEILLEKSQPGFLKMKKKIDGPFQCVKIEKKGGNMSDFGNIELDRLWPGGKPLSKEKINDLKQILKLVPDEHQHFYSFLDTDQGEDFVDDIDGFGDTIDFVLEEFSHEQ